MKFAFLVHPISSDLELMLQLNRGGTLRAQFGANLMNYLHVLRQLLSEDRSKREHDSLSQIRLLDEPLGLESALGDQADGRIYQIPMDVAEILDDPGAAMDYVQQASEYAANWGAQLVGLGSLTGIIGGHGAELDQSTGMAVTTGNSLTVYAALENLKHACAVTGVDLSASRLAVIGIPGSIGTAVARLAHKHCRELLLVARRESSPARRLAGDIDARLLTDIPEALQEADLVISATSSGDCINQKWLRPGTIVVDVGVPTDVQGSQSDRNDILVVSGGLARVPDTMPRDSLVLRLQHGVIPSCLGETIVLALDKRRESFSIGRKLEPEKVMEIGHRAEEHGFRFNHLLSFGLPIVDEAIVQFRKHLARSHSRPTAVGTNGKVHKNGRGKHPLLTSPPKQETGSASAAELHARYINPVMAAVGQASGLTKTFVRAEGIDLWDEDGNQYLDFVGGLRFAELGGTTIRKIQAAIQSTLAASAPGFCQAAINPITARAAERLISLAPTSLELAFFSNSGAESVEAALKLARAATKRHRFVSCRGSYHGKSLGALSVTGNADYQRPFGPLLQDCQQITFGDLDELEQALAGREVAAFIVEPIQGEGGVIVPPKGYLREAQQLCRQTGTVLIVDEVQTGMGRTGRMFACDAEGVEPDVLTLAKSLGGGILPVAATLMRRDLWLQAYGSLDSFALHTSTFGGGSLAGAAIEATIDVLQQEHLAEAAAEKGATLKQQLEQIVADCSLVSDVRGKGLMLGLEFAPLPPFMIRHWLNADSSGLTQFASPGLTATLKSTPALYTMQALLLDHGIFTQVTRSNRNVMRIQPPLAVGSEHIDRFVTALRQTVCDFERGIASAKMALTRSSRGVLERRDSIAI